MDLIYCADGNKRYADLAIKHGFRYGAQLPNTIYHLPYFVDQDWENPDHDKYMAALEQYRPGLASVLDWEHEEQLPEVMRWAENAAQFVTEAVIIIPKMMGGISRLPRQVNGVPVRIGYSVPTKSKKFSGTELPLWEFLGWPVHVLGGTPKKQHTIARTLDVISVDGNSFIGRSNNCQFFVAGGSARTAKNRWWPQLQESVYGDVNKDANYMAFELSCINIQAMWAGCAATIRWAVEGDLPAIKKIANQYKTELGFVMLQSLRRAITKNELYVAEYGQRVVGFCNWHRCQDGWTTIYEVAVDKTRRGEQIGRALVETVPLPRRLKCTRDNDRANRFYKHIGGEIVALEQGRKRMLYRWQWKVEGD